MPNTCSRCARRTQAQATDQTAQAAARLRALTDDTAQTEEPMRRYPHPIPACPCTAQTVEDSSAVLVEISERLACQTQLLVDLAESVNALTAALRGSCPQS